MKVRIAWPGILAAGLLLCACAAKPPVQFKVTDVAMDKTYGYSQHNPIKVGGWAQGRGADHRDWFFKVLRGPQGQPVSYVSNGTCCSFSTNDSAEPLGYLEVVLVTYKGIGSPVLLYVDTVNFDAPKAPVGFTFARPEISSGPP